jgi:hypothetical protein
MQEKCRKNNSKRKLNIKSTKECNKLNVDSVWSQQKSSAAQN